MNLTEAAAAVTAVLVETRYEYRDADLGDPALNALYAEVNAQLPRPLRTSHIDELYGLICDCEHFASEATGNRYGAGRPQAEQDALDSVHDYCTEISHWLREAGYEGTMNDFLHDSFADLEKL